MFLKMLTLALKQTKQYTAVGSLDFCMENCVKLINTLVSFVLCIFLTGCKDKLMELTYCMCNSGIQYGAVV